MKTESDRPRRFSIGTALLTLAVVGFFILVPCAIYEAGWRSALGRDIAMSHQLYIAISSYHFDHGSYPASLKSAEFQPYIDARTAEFLREGRVSYDRPAPDSPKTFKAIQITTPRGDFFVQLSGEVVFSKGVMK